MGRGGGGVPLVLFRFARYTVLTSPNKDETAVHCYGSNLSVLVVLVSRKEILFLRSINLAVMFVRCHYPARLGAIFLRAFVFLLQ